MTRTYSDVATEYAQQIVEGEILSCRWVKAAAHRELKDLAKFKGKSSHYEFNPTLQSKARQPFRPADNVCGFSELLPHVKGRLAGEKTWLEFWQVFILATTFGWVKPNGKRRFRRSYIEAPGWNAKSTLTSALAPYMLVAGREGGISLFSGYARDQARIKPAP